MSFAAEPCGPIVASRGRGGRRRGPEGGAGRFVRAARAARAARPHRARPVRPARSPRAACARGWRSSRRSTRPRANRSTAGPRSMPVRSTSCSPRWSPRSRPASSTTSTISRSPSVFVRRRPSCGARSPAGRRVARRGRPREHLAVSVPAFRADGSITGTIAARAGARAARVTPTGGCTGSRIPTIRWSAARSPTRCSTCRCSACPAATSSSRSCTRPRSRAWRRKLLSGVVTEPGDVRRVRAASCSRIAAWSMLQEPPDYAPYGWSHCLTMPQAVMGIAGDGVDVPRVTAVAATYVVGLPRRTRAARARSRIGYPWPCRTPTSRSAGRRSGAGRGIRVAHAGRRARRDRRRARGATRPRTTTRIS